MIRCPICGNMTEGTNVAPPEIQVAMGMVAAFLDAFGVFEPPPGMTALEALREAGRIHDVIAAEMFGKERWKEFQASCH